MILGKHSIIDIYDCKCNIDESMGVKVISPEGVKRVKNIEELEDSTMAYYIDFRNAEILFTKDSICYKSIKN